MTERNDEIRLLLLDILAGGDGVDRAIMAGLAPSEWATLAAMARQHRLEPMLHRNLASHPQWPVPEDIKRRWRASFRRNALRMLACERVLGHIATRLDAAQIPYAALKGAWLARHAYANPALRPLRDIDILVPAEYAMAAFDLLRAEGFEPRNLGEPLPAYALVHGKHLPGLVSPTDKINVEIHHRLLTPGVNRGRNALATEDVLGRRIVAPLKPGSITYLAPSVTLLHLIVHAVYEHEFCNGPLVLTDIACLLRTMEMDWAQLWREATGAGWGEGCNLILGLVERYHGIRAPRPSPMIQPPETMMRMAALMMLQDHAQRGRIELLSGLGAAHGLVAKLSLAARRAWPERHVLAAFAGLPAVGKFPWLHYPAWLASRLKLSVQAFSQEQQRADMRRARSLKLWLMTER